MQDLQSEQVDGGDGVENAFAPDIADGLANGVEEGPGEKLRQITLDLLDGSEDMYWFSLKWKIARFELAGKG